MVETKGLIGAIEAADAMVKAADVTLVKVEQTVAALMTVQVVGEVAAVRSAVEAGRHAAERIGQVVSAHIIPRPADEVRQMQGLDGRAPAPPQQAATIPGAVQTQADLEAMTVKELRALARDLPGLSLQGRAIARANKQQLVDALAAHR